MTIAHRLVVEHNLRNEGIFRPFYYGQIPRFWLFFKGQPYCIYSMKEFEVEQMHPKGQIKATKAI